MNYIPGHLGPAPASAGLAHVKIFAMDDQWSRAEYGRAVYTGPAAHRHTAASPTTGMRGGPAVMSAGYGEQHLTEWRSLAAEPPGLTIDGRDHTGCTVTMAPGELSTFVW